jgi:hypothetical protein
VLSFSARMTSSREGRTRLTLARGRQGWVAAGHTKTPDESY